MKENRIIQSLAVCSMALTTMLCSCKKFVQITPPKTQVESSKIFSNDRTAESAVVGLYVQLVASNNTFSNGAITLYTGLFADELVNTASSSTNDPFKTNTLLATNTTILQTFWTAPYRYIYQANAILEGLTASMSLTGAVKQRLTGEMLFIRALQYFYMTNLFGDVPLELTTDYRANSVMPRTGNEKIYDQIVADLVQARILLSGGSNTLSNTRAGKDAATALLARVYLYRGDWADAESMASEVISSGKYTLEDLDNVFLSTSKETVFQISRQDQNTAEGALFIPSSSLVRPAYAITNSLFSAFDPGDNRSTKWIKSNTVNGATYYYPFKYKVRNNASVTESYIVLRLAELYLIRAEARAQLNNLSAAISDVDAIRSRAGLSQALIKDIRPDIDKDALLSAILKERQMELFAEWGHRWLDLKRTGEADAILESLKAPNWQPTDKLFPIPYSEIQTNPALTQNEGYTN